MADLFVEMEKGGVLLVVHPSTVNAHKRAGWVVVKEGVVLAKGKSEAEKADKHSSEKSPAQDEAPAK